MRWLCWLVALFTAGLPASGALAPAATWLWLYALLASSFGDILAWRGVRYRLSREGCERLP